MSVDLPDGGATALARAEARTRAVMDDLFLPDEARLPDRVRTAAASMLRTAVESIETALRRATGMADAAGTAYPMLGRAGVLRDAALVEELVGEAAREWLEERLLPGAEAGEQGLTARLLDDADPDVRAATAKVVEGKGQVRLPADIHRWLAWRVAAALRGSGDANTEAQLALAASSLEAGESGAQAAERLIEMLERRSRRSGSLLADALRDRSTVLFVAMLARAVRLDYGQARMLLVEPTEPMLWVALRSAGLRRGKMAEIGAILAEADPRRDLHGLADALDAVTALSAEAVERLLDPLRLPAGFRHAIRALEAAT